MVEGWKVEGWKVEGWKVEGLMVEGLMVEGLMVWRLGSSAFKSLNRIFPIAFAESVVSGMGFKICHKVGNLAAAFLA